MYLYGKTTQLKPIAFIFAVFINSMPWASEIIITGPDQGAPKYYNENAKAKEAANKSQTPLAHRIVCD